MFILINWGVITANEFDSVKRIAKRTVIFSVPFFAFLIFFELLAQIAGGSYIIHLLQYSGTITDGSWEEGLSYVFKYIRFVENWWGVFLLVLFFIGVLVSLKLEKSSKRSQVLYLGVAAYIIFGSYVYFFQNMVFYGRTFHMYYPFIILGSLFIIERLGTFKKKTGISLCILAFLNYGFIINDVNNLGYPRSSIYEYSIIENDSVRCKHIHEIGTNVRYENNRANWCDDEGHLLEEFIRNEASSCEEKNEWLISKDEFLNGCYPYEESFKEDLTYSGLSEGNYELVNFCIFATPPENEVPGYIEYNKPADIYTEYKVDERDSIILEKLHYMSHPVYLFDFCNKEDREFFLEKKLKLRVIKVK